MEQLKEQEKFTYHDYLTWDDNQRWELIDGVPYMMAAPRIKHQTVLGNLHYFFKDYLKDKSCKVMISPVDVKIDHQIGDREDDDTDTVVQPDLIIVCDPSKIGEKAILGAPDMIVEILSPSNTKMDRWIKFNRYQVAGVKEYWIVDTLSMAIEVYLLTAPDTYTRDHMYEKEGEIPVKIFKDLVLDVADIFA